MTFKTFFYHTKFLSDRLSQKKIPSEQMEMNLSHHLLSLTLLGIFITSKDFCAKRQYQDHIVQNVVQHQGNVSVKTNLPIINCRKGNEEKIQKSMVILCYGGRIMLGTFSEEFLILIPSENCQQACLMF